MRLILSLALVVSMTASAQAGGCFGKKTSKCCSAPCATSCSPCGASACGSGCGDSGCGSASGCGASACGTWETVEKTVLVPQMVTETRTVTVNVPVQEERQGTRTVCKTVSEPQEQTYTVMVPYTEERQGTRTVCKTVTEAH